MKITIVSMMVMVCALIFARLYCDGQAVSEGVSPLIVFFDSIVIYFLGVVALFFLAAFYINKADGM